MAAAYAPEPQKEAKIRSRTKSEVATTKSSKELLMQAGMHSLARVDGAASFASLDPFQMRAHLGIL